MNRRALIVSLLVLLGLVVYAWFALRQDERERDGRWQDGDRVFSAAREGIETLELSGPEGRRASFRRVEGGWESVGGDGEILPESVPELLYGWSLLRFSLYVDENPGDLSTFGLDPPRYRLVAGSEDGRRYSLAIGADSTLSTALGAYARVNEIPAVIMLDVSVWNLVEELDLAFGLAEDEELAGPDLRR